MQIEGVPVLLTETWRKSSKTPFGSDTCAEVRLIGNRVEIRNSNNPDAGTATFTREEWVAFTAGVKNNEFEV